MLGMIGRKVGMSAMYDEQNRYVACTLIEALPCVVTQVKKGSKEGYEAVQLAAFARKAKTTSKPLQGHFQKASTAPKHIMAEFRDFAQDWGKALELGSEVRIEDVFEQGEYIDVVGHAKGKGHQGVVKRHGFAGVGQRTHGQHDRARAAGSIGASSFPSRVFKGMRMAGRAGGQRVKVANLRVMQIVPEKNLLVVCGAVPGAAQSYVFLQK